jgi:c-di-GMP-binding flagellar brake protein YcgR
MPFESEKKRSPRADVDWPVIIETAQKRIKGKILNISAVGAFICCEAAVESDEMFAIAISVPLLNQHIVASAKVKRADFHCLDDEIMSHGMGVEFTRISDKDRELISKLVSG